MLRKIWEALVYTIGIHSRKMQATTLVPYCLCCNKLYNYVHSSAFHANGSVIQHLPSWGLAMRNIILLVSIVLFHFFSHATNSDLETLYL